MIHQRNTNLPIYLGWVERQINIVIWQESHEHFILMYRLFPNVTILEGSMGGIRSCWSSTHLSWRTDKYSNGRIIDVRGLEHCFYFQNFMLGTEGNISTCDVSWHLGWFQDYDTGYQEEWPLALDKIIFHNQHLSFIRWLGMWIKLVPFCFLS